MRACLTYISIPLEHIVQLQLYLNDGCTHCFNSEWFCSTWWHFAYRWSHNNKINWNGHKVRTWVSLTWKFILVRSPNKTNHKSASLFMNILVQISNPDATLKHFLSLKYILRILQPWQRHVLSECFLDEYALKSGKAVCHYFSKLRSNQSLHFFVFILVLSPSFNISNKRIFKNKWYTADFKLQGLCKKHVFLVPPSYKNKARYISQQKRKMCCLQCL